MHVLTLTPNADAPFMNQQMAALERRGVEFTVLSVDGDVGPKSSRTVRDYLRFFPQVVREARNGYDLVHVHFGLLAPMALAQVRKPVVLSLWGSDLYGPFGPVSRACAPLCDSVVVMSEDMRRTLGQECTVIPDGIDLEKFSPEPRDRARERVGWPRDEYHVLFPYDPERDVKNYPRARRIVDAVERLVDRPVTLQVVYDADHDAVPWYMNASNALLLTSRSEGSPNSVKEAMACNVPVVATDVGDVDERLTDVEPSTVSSNDADLVAGLHEILERGERSNGRESAREVSVDDTADRMLEVYERTSGETVTDRQRSPPTERPLRSD